MNVADARFRIAAARRMLARAGCESMVAGHVSERAVGEDAFWISPFEYFDETLPSRPVKVGFDLQVLDGVWEASPAIQFHAAIYAARPDVGSVVHTHSQHVSTYVTCNEPIGVYNICASPFAGDQAVYVEDGLIPPVEGPRVAAALADHDVLLLSNHGVILVGPTLEETTTRAILIEQAARFHVDVVRAGGTAMSATGIPARKTFYRETVMPLMWEAGLLRLEDTDPELFAAAAVAV